MNRTRKNLLHLYADITAYAAAKIRDYGLPRCDLGDIVSEAYLKAQRKLPRHVAHRNRNALFKTIAWCAVFDELDRRNRISVLHDKHDLRLDADKPSPDGTEGDDGPETDGFAISDEGAGAESIRSFDEPDDEPETDETPEWVYGVREQYGRERGRPRMVLDRLKKCWDHEEVRHDLSLSPDVFYKILKKIQIRFDQCFRAYHAWLAEKSHRVG